MYKHFATSWSVSNKRQAHARFQASATFEQRECPEDTTTTSNSKHITRALAGPRDFQCIPLFVRSLCFSNVRILSLVRSSHAMVPSHHELRRERSLGLYDILKWKIQREVQRTTVIFHENVLCVCYLKRFVVFFRVVIQLYRLRD